MKKLCTLFFIAFSSSLLYSQGDITFGIFGGFNYAMLAGDEVDDVRDDLEEWVEYYDDDDDFDEDILRGRLFGRPGIHFGVNGSYKINQDISIYSSLSYSQKGFIRFRHVTGEYEEYWNGWTGEYYYDADFEYRRVEKVKLNYVDFPIGVKYKLSKSIDIFGGILFSRLLSDNVEWTLLHEIDGEEVNDYDEEDDDDYDDYFGDNPEDLLTGVQVGICHSVRNKVFSFTINKNSDFGEMWVNGDDEDFSNVTLQISLGTTF